MDVAVLLVGLVMLLLGVAAGAIVVWVANRKAAEKATDTFKALSADALQQSQDQFLQLAETRFAQLGETAKGDLDLKKKEVEKLVEPLGKQLEKLNDELHGLEKERAQASGELKKELENLAKTHAQLQKETSSLAGALRSPTVRGRWGEVQLRRVVELAGMVEYCDFDEQVSCGETDERLRPDMVVKLPNNRTIVVDAKAPLESYLEAVESDDENVRRAKMDEHAAHVRTHLRSLGKKSYWNNLESSPEFVVLFLPGESFFSAALEQDPELLEFGAEQRVILATPTTLIALLKAVAYGWQQEQVAENAEAIRALGKDLYDRIGKVADYFSKLGKNLNSAVCAYNDAVGSLERRLLPQARKMRDLGAAGGNEIETPVLIDESTRALQAEELVGVEEQVEIEG